MGEIFFTYLVRCSDDTLYTGYTNDLEERIKRHNMGKAAKYTRARRPVELVYYETFPTKREAMVREATIKKLTRQQKIRLIKGDIMKKDEVVEGEGLANQQQGVLYLCATPLGNLEDITLRVLRILKESDLIAAEDTRRTIKLLNHYDIKTPLTSYHEHNEVIKGEKLLQELLKGKRVALVSDAGMPGISDPGEVIVRMALEKGIPVVPVPGPSAGITALVASGLKTGSFLFVGFLAREKKVRKTQLAELAEEKHTMILYEAPHRLKKTLQELLVSMGDRNIVLARELTKVHEEFIRGKTSEVLERLNCQPSVKGEFCLIIEGRPLTEIKKDLPNWEGEKLLEQVQIRINKGLSKKEAIKEVANQMGKPKRQVYNELLKWGAAE